MKTTPLLRKIILVLLPLFVLFLILINFITIPYIAGENAIPVFKDNKLVLSEKITFLFRKPQVGDRVVFTFSTPDGYHTVGNLGLIIGIEDNEGNPIYLIQTIKDGKKPFYITLEEIELRIYFPLVDKITLQNVINSYSVMK